MDIPVDYRYEFVPNESQSYDRAIFQKDRWIYYLKIRIRFNPIPPVTVSQ